jgi:hypothetical protein
MVENYTYPDKLGFGETIMFTIRVMSHELATDGMDEQYEDLVDHLGWLLMPLIKGDEKKKLWDVAMLHKIDAKKTEILEFSRAKRERIALKMDIIMDILHKNGLLLKRVQTFDTEFDYTKLPIEG